MIDEFEAEILQVEKDKLIRNSFENDREKDEIEIEEFINNRLVEKIIGMTENKQGEKIFAIKLLGLKEVMWVPNESAKKRCPQKVRL